MDSVDSLAWDGAHHGRVKRWLRAGSHEGGGGGECVLRLAPLEQNSTLRDTVLSLLSVENARSNASTRRAVDLLTDAFLGTAAPRLALEFVDDAAPENAQLGDTCTVDGKCAAPPRTARTDGRTITIHSTVRTVAFERSGRFRDDAAMGDASTYAFIVLHEFGHVLHFNDATRSLYEPFWTAFRERQRAVPSPTQFLLFGEFVANEFARTFVNCYA